VDKKFKYFTLTINSIEVSTSSEMINRFNTLKDSIDFKISLTKPIKHEINKIKLFDGILDNMNETKDEFKREFLKSQASVLSEHLNLDM
jgi:hypothetical protein